jgi:deoxyribodipyrimidine photolyase-related protein
MQTIWILADQLSPDNVALAAADPAKSIVLIVESKARGEVVRYHQQKLVLVYAGMRHFARDLEATGWRVDYHRLEDTPDFSTGLSRHVERWQPAEIVLAAPNDYAMTEALPKFARRVGVPVRALPTNQFLLSREDFAEWAGDRPHLIMEEHYRRMRRRTGWLMEKPVGSRAAKPSGGEWNFDPLNRLTYKQYAASGHTQPAVPLRERPDEITREVISLVERHFPDHPGRAGDFWFPVDRAGALRWLEHFVTERLEHFGPFEDVLAQDHPVIYHSVLSPLLNLGLLHPRECVERVVAAYEAGRAPIQSVEGFVRQVIGWREFINGAYWHAMPGYKEVNYLQATRPVPAWFYTGETDLNCLRQAIRQALDLGWLHHIQRLMVVGNFFLLAGIDPTAALRWFLEMTVDAYDWVMVPNALGMILYADGGYIATKPYAAGGGYINKMSNYCAGCRYSPLQKVGPDACPFNALYWDFHARHAEVLRENPRIGRTIHTWEARSKSEQAITRASAASFLNSL